MSAAHLKRAFVAAGMPVRRGGGWYHADLYLSRPAIIEASELPVDELLGGARGAGVLTAASSIGSRIYTRSQIAQEDLSTNVSQQMPPPRIHPRTAGGD